MALADTCIQGRNCLQAIPGLSVPTATAPATSTAAAEATLATTAVAALAAATAAAVTAAFTTTATATAVAALTTAATAVAALAATAAAVAAAFTFFLGSGFIDIESPALQIFAVQAFNSRLSRFFRGHLDEPETFRSAAEFIVDNADRGYFTELAEGLPQIIFLHIVRHIPYIDLHFLLL